MKAHPLKDQRLLEPSDLHVFVPMEQLTFVEGLKREIVMMPTACAAATYIGG